MIEVLEFIFQDPTHFFGTLVLLAIISNTFSGMINITTVSNDKEKEK
jgi:hypothetical protein